MNTRYPQPEDCIIFLAKYLKITESKLVEILM